MMTSKVGICALAITTLFCACKTAPESRAQPFNEADILKVINPSTPGSLHGQVFAKTVGGDVKVGAGETVAAIPATKYTREEVDRRVLGGRVLEPIDKRLAKWAHLVTADAGGNFHMDLLPSGTWFVYSRVVWWAPTGLYGSLQQQGGGIAKEIVIEPGQNVEVLLYR